MSFASGSSHGLSFVPEVTYGTTPVTPAMVFLRHTSCGIGLGKDSMQSNELRSDRQISGFRHGAKRVQGDIAFEFSAEEFDPLLEAALFGTFAAIAPLTLKAGTTPKSFTFERAFNDVTPKIYGKFSGCMINTFSLNVPANAMVTGSFGVIGQTGSYSGTPLKALPAASKTHTPFATFNGTISEGGSATAIVTSVSLSLQNGLEPAFVIGSDMAAKLTSGRCNVTGQVSAYFDSMVLLNKFLNETESSLSFTLTEDGRGYTFELPKIKYSGGDNPASGEGPIQLNLPFQALYDSTAGTNLSITKIVP